MLRLLSSAAALGAAVGGSLLVLDVGLLRLCRGFAARPALDHWLAYATSGALIAIAVACLRARASGRQPATGWLAASVVCLLYAIPVIERVHHAFPNATPAIRLLLALLAAALAYTLWLASLRVAAAAPAPALLLAGLSTALVLALNRNLVERPFASTAILLDAAVALLALGLALAVRRYGAGRTGTVAGGAALVTLLLGLVLTSPLASGFAGRASAQTNATGSAPPHLVLVVIDTLRLDVFEDVVRTTPEGARFAQSLAAATWFRNAIAISPWTVPSVATILTGLYPAEHRYLPVAGDILDVPPLAPQVPTLAGRLRRAGYHGEGLVTSPYLRPGTGLERGFAHYELVEGAGERLPLVVALLRAGLIEPQLYPPAAQVRSRLAERLARLPPEPGPLFLFLHLFDPHVPLLPHPELPAEPRTAGLPLEERLYRDETRYTLSEVAKVLELLQTAGILDHSVVAVVADHGELFRSDGRHGRRHGGAEEHLLTGHGNGLYAELLRVPLVLRALSPAAPPRPPSSQTVSPIRYSDALVSHVDLVTTLLELLGLEAETEAPERFSVAHLVAGDEERAPPRSLAAAAFNASLPPLIALQNRRFKLVHFPNGEQTDELYDLRNDPHERHNVAAEHAAALAAGQDLLERLGPLLTPPERDSLAEPRTLDEATRRRLKALGYL